MKEGSALNAARVALARGARAVKHALWSNFQEKVPGHTTSRRVTNCMKASHFFKYSGSESWEVELMRSKDDGQWF